MESERTCNTSNISIKKKTIFHCTARPCKMWPLTQVLIQKVYSLQEEKQHWYLTDKSPTPLKFHIQTHYAQEPADKAYWQMKTPKRPRENRLSGKKLQTAPLKDSGYGAWGTLFNSWLCLAAHKLHLHLTLSSNFGLLVLIIKSQTFLILCWNKPLTHSKTDLYIEDRCLCTS